MRVERGGVGTRGLAGGRVMGIFPTALDAVGKGLNKSVSTLALLTSRVG